MVQRNTRTGLKQELGVEWKAAEKSAAAAWNAKGYEEAEGQEEEGNEVETWNRGVRKVD